jgi:hypothetical protein
MYDGKQAYDHPAFFQPLRPAVQELIDSAMEQRSYNKKRIPDAENLRLDDTLSNCSNGRASLERGSAWRIDDPPGMSHEDAIRLHLAN